MGWQYEPITIAESVRLSADLYQTATLSAKIEGASVTISADFDGILSASVVESVRLSADIYEGFQIPPYDHIDITYSGSNIATVVYCAASVLLNTLTLTFSGDNLITVVKT